MQQCPRAGMAVAFQKFAEKVFEDLPADLDAAQGSKRNRATKSVHVCVCVYNIEITTNTAQVLPQHEGNHSVGAPFHVQ